MESYKSQSGKKSGVIAYEIEEYAIRVKFDGGKVYRYSSSSCGDEHLSNMIELALQQEGLATYISRYQPEPE